MAAQEIRVPDIGDFTDVPIIEIHVSPGDTVAVEDPHVTLESDKATMAVPSPAAGTVVEVAAKVGDRVSEGEPLCTLLASAEGPALDRAVAEVSTAFEVGDGPVAVPALIVERL
jgi:pyruvate/2-oxoglutarate dehydrogenase complex dihydrolipoamide acyltransferase (E2) component